MYPLHPLPIQSVSPGTDLPAIGPPDGSVTHRILVVEDTDHLRASTIRILTAQGYAVTEARHGEAALQLIEEATEPFNLVITDVMLPVMSGYKLGRRLAVCQPQLPVLYMSAAPNDASVGRGVPSGLPPGLAPCLQKPFRPEALVREVAALLGPDI